MVTRGARDCAFRSSKKFSRGFKDIFEIEFQVLSFQILINKEEIKQVFDKVIEKSDNWEVEKILEFGSHLSTIIYHYRQAQNSQPSRCRKENVNLFQFESKYDFYEKYKIWNHDSVGLHLQKNTEQ